MIAADTNVLARFLVWDDEAQAKRAEKLLSGEACFVPASVWLELEWVLRGVYRLPRAAVQEGLRRLLAMEGIRSDMAAALNNALDLHAAGLDFADAFHLALSPDCQRFATFDREFARLAKRAGVQTEVFAP